MKLEIDMPEHHYNSIIAFDSVSLGRAPYKGIIMYAINAIKHGRTLEQESTTKNDLAGDCISRTDAIKGLGEQPYVWTDSDFEIQQLADWKTHKEMLENLPPVTPQKPKTGKWISTETKGVRYAFWCRYKCSLCGELSDHTNFCPNCGAKMVEPQESEVEDGKID